MARASILLPVLLALCAALVVNSASSQNAPAPSVDCTSLVLNLADCLPFVTNGSKDTKPQGSCCTGLKTVLKTDAECLCETFKKSSSFGVVLNVSKALTLPASCGVSAPSASKCGLSLATGNSPAHSPMGAPTPMSSTSPSLSPTGEPVSDAATTPAPAPSPGSSGAAGVQISIAVLLVSLVVVASCSYF